MIREKYGDSIIKWVLKSNPDGWLLSQRGNHYELEALERDEDNSTYKVGGEDGEWIEDELGRMHHFEGVPLGLHLDQARQVTDIEDATVATGNQQKIADGGELRPGESMTPEEIVQHLQVGTVNTGGGTEVKIVNPYLARTDLPELVDLRDTMRLFRHAADPNNPVKAAKNAVEAERAVQGMDWGNAAQIGGMIAAFLMGAITVEYIAGGGGGGGGVNVGLMIMQTFSMLL